MLRGSELSGVAGSEGKGTRGVSETGIWDFGAAGSVDPASAGKGLAVVEGTGVEADESTRGLVRGITASALPGNRSGGSTLGVGVERGGTGTGFRSDGKGDSRGGWASSGNSGSGCSAGVDTGEFVLAGFSAAVERSGVGVDAELAGSCAVGGGGLSENGLNPGTGSVEVSSGSIGSIG